MIRLINSFKFRLLCDHGAFQNWSEWCFIFPLLALGHFCEVDHPGRLSPQVSPLQPRDISPTAVWPVPSWELRKAALYSHQPDAVCPVSGSVLRRRVEQQRWVPVLQRRLQRAAVRQAGVHQHAEPRLRVHCRQIPGARVLFKAHRVSSWIRRCTARYVLLFDTHRLN